MKGIIKIVIKGSSGNYSPKMPYKDKITILSDSISYDYKPLWDLEGSTPINWRYKTNSLVFKEHFHELVSVMPKVIQHDTNTFCADIGGIEFIVTFDDKTRWKQVFWLPGDEFWECFKIVRQMVPACEKIPEVLHLSEDFYEEE